MNAIWRRNKLILLPVLALCLLTASSFSFSASSSSTNFNLSRSVFGSAGGLLTSDNFRLQHSIGQNFTTGKSSSINTNLHSGFISVADTDGDNIFDNTDNCVNDVNTSQLDTDNDGQGNPCDIDDDGDGLSDITEAALGTNPLNTDSDNDGLSDFDETNMDGNPLLYQPGIDTDPNDADTDNDGLLDGVDPNPLIAITDGDLTQDGVLDIRDLLRAYQIIIDQDTATALEMAHGDVYPPGAPDGILNMSDAILIQQLIENQP